MKKWMGAGIIVVCILIGCCMGSRGAGIHWKDGDYRVYTRPVSGQVILGYYMGDGATLGLSDATVVAAGSDSRYVVFKREPNAGPLEYYYVRKSPGDVGEVLGPLTEAEFAKVAKAGSLPNFSWNLEH